jgi:hypothetical protein
MSFRNRKPIKERGGLSPSFAATPAGLVRVRWPSGTEQHLTAEEALAQASWFVDCGNRLYDAVWALPACDRLGEK